MLTAEHVEQRDLGGSEGPTVMAEDSGRGDLPSVAWQKLQGARARIDEQEQVVIRDAMARASGVVAHAARELGIARTTLASRLDVLGMRVRPLRSE